MARNILIIFLFLALWYVGIAAFFYFAQDRFVFLPDRQPFAEMEAKAKAKGFVPWLNAKGERIGWQSTEGNEQDVILVFNGQGGNALYLAFIRECCRPQAGNWKTFLLEYPGYGAREGVPSEKSLTAAGLEAVDTLAAVPGRRIWLAGQSLGSGTACAVVRERSDKIAGLLLLTPFNSMVATAAARYRWLPIAALLRTRFESDKNLANYPGPVAIFVSGKDTTIPPALGEKLYEDYRGRKRLWIDPESNHDVSGLLLKDWGSIVKWLEGEGK